MAEFGSAVADRFGKSDMAQLAAAAQAWLPTDDPRTRQRILDLLAQAATTGGDPVAALRQAMSRWFGADVAVMLPPVPGNSEWSAARHDASGGVALEPLGGLRPPTLWPQRPKRLADELFSSWLWRAAIAAAVPPAAFARHMVGANLDDDIDHDIAPQILRRLAQASGQTVGRLAAGTLTAPPWATQDTLAGMAEDLMLGHAALLATRVARATIGHPRPVLQYCPCCLADDPRPYFRRRWRFAPIVACRAHRCLLHEGCWRCGAPVALLGQRAASLPPRCNACEAALADAVTSTATGVVPRQGNLEAMLGYLVVQVPAAQRAGHLARLGGRFAPGMSLAARVAVMAQLLPANWREWFGSPDDPGHATGLRMLASGVRALERTRVRRHRRRMRGEDVIGPVTATGPAAPADAAAGADTVRGYLVR